MPPSIPVLSLSLGPIQYEMYAETCFKFVNIQLFYPLPTGIRPWIFPLSDYILAG